MEHIKIIPLKSSLSRRKTYIRAINNLAYNEHTYEYFKWNKILNFFDKYKLQVSNYIFQVLHSNINEEIESSLLFNNQIHSPNHGCHNTRTNNQMNILLVNWFKTKHCVLHNGMITWNSLPDVFKVNIFFSMFKSKVRNFYIENYMKILMLGATMIAFFSDMLPTAVFQV